MKTLKYSKLSSAAAAAATLLGALATLPLHAQSFTQIMTNQAPLDWWRLGETAPSPAVNSVSNLGSLGVNGTGYVLGGVTLGEPGIVGSSSAYFANPSENVGDCSAWIDVPNTPGLNPPPPFSVEFWMMPNAAFDPSDTTGLCPLSSLSADGTGTYDGARSGYTFYVVPGTIELRAGGPESYSFTCAASATISTVTWTHVVGEFDGTTAHLYLNGVLAATTTATGGPFLPNPFQPLRIGGTTLYGDTYGGDAIFSGNRGWDGWVDKVAVYSNILSASTVMAHYSAGTNTITTSTSYDTNILASHPVGYWNLNEPAYTVPPTNVDTFAGDLGSLMDGGTNTLGTIAGQPGVPGLSANDHSVFYNGVSGSVVPATTNAAWDVQGGGLTLMAWIKPRSFGYIEDIIAQGYDQSSLAENFLRCGDCFDWEYFAPDDSGGDNNTNLTPGVVYYSIGTYDGMSPAYNTAVYPAPPGDIGNWVFLVGTYDTSAGQWNLYRNGQPVAVFPDGGVGPSDVVDADGNLLPFSVGSASLPSEYYGMFFSGSIQEAAIFNKALPAATVLQLYNSVGLPPVITEAPVAPSPAYLGSTATFSVWAEGPGTLSYQWESNNVALAGQTATNFTLVGLVPSDSATYSVVVTNQYGSITSSVVLVVADTLPPAVVVPVAESRWVGSPLSFGLLNPPTIQLSYQWRHNGTNISGATGSNYTAATLSSSAGSYTVLLSNSLAVATSSVAVLTALPIPTNTPYPGVILGDHPLTYLRLDETSGSTAYDYAGGNNGTYFGNVTLGVPGYSLVDTDTAAYFPGLPLDFCGNFGATNIDFGGTTAEFSIEAWANGSANQAAWAPVICKGHENNGTTANEQFIILDDGGQYAFIVKDAKGNAVAIGSSFAPDGNWHLLDGVCDFSMNELTFYIDGAMVSSSSLSALSNGLIYQTDPVSIGAESTGPSPDYALDYNGTISQVAIYAYPLSATQVLNHYNAVYGENTAPFILDQPVSVTNFVGLSATLSVTAAGSIPLSYQWNMVGSGPIPGATGRTYTIANLSSANAGTYTVGITNTLSNNVVAGIVSVPVTITVIPIPTNPPAIAGLVMHLPMTNTLMDVTGRGNNATNAASGGAPLLTNDFVPGGPIGDGYAFYYQTTVSGTNVSANYATVGVRPDLQFGTNSFTVSFWIQEPLYYNGEDLPFFCDVVGSTFGFPGYCFCPGFTNSTWAYSVFDATGNGAGDGIGVYGNSENMSPPALIDDFVFHNLVYVIDVVNGARVYLDGVLSYQNVVQGTSVVGIGSINSTNAATIGQDPTGLYSASSSGTWEGNYFAMQDLGVWNRALTPLEAASIYVVGFNSGLSFTGAPILTYQNIPGAPLVLTWNEGSLQSATKLIGPWTTLLVTSPYTNTPATNTYYRVKYPNN